MTAAGLSARLGHQLGARPAFLAGSSSPTADLYFAFACADRIARDEVRRLAPTVFAVGDTLIVFRHAAGLGRLPPHRRLIYLIDDDIRAGLTDRGVPAAYRLKLLALEWPAVRQFERQADVILTTSARLTDRLCARLPGKPVHEIEPAWPLPSAEPRRSTADACRIALLMGRSHARDAAPLMRLLGQVLARHPGVELILSANLPVPPPPCAEHPASRFCPPWAGQPISTG
ncbi:hypothetical protein [Rhodovulum steppense]|uniref:Glycosyl transferase family 4 n=1 Tax=Rhodovulum steppense TaxID=540251 RepID=A0A4R1YHW5_9RHOB|nr:hypothetical protein [Rhodovulum steppense]TCM75892.1 hypothetical protein EV216_13620 [Rhodovulum steppense]